MQERTRRKKRKLRETIASLENYVGAETKNLNRIFDSIAVTPANYWQTFTGNFIRRIFTNAGKIYNSLSDAMKQSPRVKNAIEALKLMALIQGIL